MSDIAAKTDSSTDGSVSNVSRTIKPGTRGERARLLVNDVAVRDGQRIIEHPTADFFLAYQIMTNFGVPADLAKTQLRPILNRLAAVADSNRHMIVEGERHIKELDAARNDPSASTLEKAMLMQGLAVSRDVFLQRMTDLRDQNLGELAVLVEGLGVNGSDELLKRLKRVEPIEPPPPRETN